MLRINELLDILSTGLLEVPKGPNKGDRIAIFFTIAMLMPLFQTNLLFSVF